MSTPRAPITEADAKRLVALVKREGVRVRYQRRPDLPVIEISPELTASDVDEKDDIVL